MQRIIAINNIKITLLLLAALQLITTFGQAQVCQNKDSDNNWNNSWISCNQTSNPNSTRPNSHWILYEFDEPQAIDASHIWNANRNGESDMGIKEAIIDYSTDGQNWTSLGSFSFPRANESNNYEGFDGPDFGGIFISKILITVTETHGNTTCASLAEMQFNINPDACYGELDACGVCNGEGQTTWYADKDGDGLGDSASTTQSCDQPIGFVANSNDDCDTGVIGWNVVGTIFSENGCTGCHNENSASGLNLLTYETTISGGRKCGTDILSGTTLVDIITTDSWTGCSEPFIGPSMNARVGGQIDANELALIQKWVSDGTPEDCNCPGGSPDGDNDGVCDEIDNCPNLDNSLIGTPCDDNSDCTINDVWQENCNCTGTLIDRDGDGICDTEDVEPDNPCTADGVIDGVEPAGWIAHPDNDCDVDGISVASGDLDDFSACVDREGMLNTAVCNCGDTVVDEGGIFISSSGLNNNDARRAEGLPDGVFTPNIHNNSDTITLQFPFMEAGEEICITAGFSVSAGRMRLFLNNRLMTINNATGGVNYAPQEFCFPTFDAGIQTLVITDEGPGNIRVDGSRYLSCPCSDDNDNDIKNVTCLANTPGVGWEQVPDCTINICEGESITLGTNRYETVQFRWTGPNGFSQVSSTISLDDVKPSQSGFYWIFYQNPSGCNLNKRMVLNVLPTPAVTPTIRQPSCGLVNGEIRLTFPDNPSQENIEFSVEGENGNYLEIPDNLGEFTYSSLAEGTYDVWARWDGGECPVNLGVFTLIDQPAPMVDLGPNVTICEGEAVTLDATVIGSGMTYRWNDNNNKPKRTLRPNLDAYADQTFNYRVTVTDQNGCTDTDQMNIRVNAIPQITVKVDHPKGSSSSGAITFNFPDHPTRTNLEFSIDGQNGTYKKIADNNKLLKIIDLAAGNYDAWVRWDGGACPLNLGIIRLKADETCPTINATASTTSVCEGEALTLKVNKGTGWKYLWSNGATTAEQTIQPALIEYSNGVIEYSVTVTDANGCSSIDQVDVSVVSSPRVTVNSLDISCDEPDGAVIFEFDDHPARGSISFSVNGKNGTYKSTNDKNGSFIIGNLNPGVYDTWARWGDQSCPVSLGQVEIREISTIPDASISGTRDILCGDSNGAITFKFKDHPQRSWISFSVNGKGGPYKNVNDSNGSFVFENLNKGNYDTWVRWGDGSCAVNLGKVELKEISAKPQASFSIQGAHCGVDDGAITLKYKDDPKRTWISFSINGKNGPYKSVNDASRTYTFDNLAVGKYDIWIRWGDSTCPMSLGIANLKEVTSSPKVSISSLGSSCGLANGAIKFWFQDELSRASIAFSVNGENGKYKSVNDASGPFTYEGLKAGIYDVWARWGNGDCPINLGKVEVMEGTPNPIVNMSSTPAGCGTDDGSITLKFPNNLTRAKIAFSIDGENGPFRSMNDAIGTYTFQQLSIGNYDIWAQWANGDCPVSLGKVNITEQTPRPQATVSTVPASCGTADGSIVLKFQNNPGRSSIAFSIEGENGSYKTLDDSKGSYKFDNLLAGSYDIWSRWGNGDCPVPLGQYDVIENSFSPVVAVSAVAASCGIADGEIVLKFPNDPSRSSISFSINGQDGPYQTIEDSKGTFRFNNLNTGSYNVWARWGNGDCPLSLGNIKVTEKTPSPQATVNLTAASCGVADGEIVLKFVNDPNRSSISFSIEGKDGRYQTVDDSKGSFKFSDLKAGNYDVWARWGNGDCPAPLGEVELMEKTSSPQATVSTTAASCGVADGVILLQFAKDPHRTKVSFGINGQDGRFQTIESSKGSYSFSKLDAGSYDVWAKWGNGDCPVSLGEVEILEKTPRPQATVSMKAANCDKTDGSLTFRFSDNPSRGTILFSINGKSGPYKAVNDATQSYTFDNLDVGNYDLWTRWGDQTCPIHLGNMELKENENCLNGIMVKKDETNNERLKNSADLFSNEKISLKQSRQQIQRISDEQSIPKDFIKIFPNPLMNSTLLNIEYYAQEEGINLKVLNLTGQVVKRINSNSIHVGKNEFRINISNLSTGTYVIIDSNGNYKRFVVVE